MRAVEERRHIIDHDRPHVEMLTGVDIEAAAEVHGKCGVSLLSRRQRIGEIRAHVLDAEQRVRERRDAVPSPVKRGPIIKSYRCTLASKTLPVFVST